MKRFITVVAVQMDIEPLDKEKNIQKALAFMQGAIAERGQVDLFVLPEDFITGPIPKHLATHTLENTSPEIITFLEFAKKRKTHIVLGSFIKMIESKFYNTTLVINDEGKIILEHHKTKPFSHEGKYISKGKTVRAIKTKIGTIGILNCWELADPLIGRNLLKQGVEIFCCPSYWTTGDLPKSAKSLNNNFDVDFINAIVPALSFQTASLVVYANVCGDAKIQLSTKQIKLTGAAQSQIVAPVLGRVCHMPDVYQEGYIFYNYDRNLAKIAEKVTNVREQILEEDN